MSTTIWKISVVVDNDSWILPCAQRLVTQLKQYGHDTKLCQTYHEIVEGDMAFYLGCVKIAPPQVLQRNKKNLVVHESALPRGRGFAPIAWQILEGKDSIPIVLFEAVERPDSGFIYLRDKIILEGHELMEEIRRLQGEKTIELCREFVRRYPDVTGTPQRGEGSWYSRRYPKDSRLDPDKTLREQFPLLRIVDNERYPAFFDLEGHRYVLRVEKASGSSSVFESLARSSIAKRP